MSRPADWWVLDLPGDPTPGDPVRVRALARSAARMADDAGDAHRAVRGLAGDSAVLSWLGAAGQVFRGALGDFPQALGKLQDSYERAADALGWWAGRLDDLQATADRALAQGRQARVEVEALQAQLASARAAASSASAASARLAQAPAGGPPPDPAQLRAAVSSASAAAGRVSALSGQLQSAQARLSAARSMAEQARELRRSDARTTAHRLREASDAGVAPASRWERFKDAAAAAWRATVRVATVVAVVVAVVALFLGGPLVWGALLAASALLLADSLHRYGTGEASAWEVGLDLLGVVPGGRLLTAAGRLTGLAGAGARVAGAVGRPLSAAAQALRRGAEAVRHGAARVTYRVTAGLDGRMVTTRFAERYMDGRAALHRITGGRFNERGDLLVRRWDEVRHTRAEQPLDDFFRSTFRSGTYDEVMARHPRELHRVVADGGKPRGPFWTHQPQAGPQQAQLDLALKPEWNVTTTGGWTTTNPQATHAVRTEVPLGTRYFEGPAGPQVSTGAPTGGTGVSIPGRLEGGATQVVLTGMRDSTWPVTAPVPLRP